MKMKLDAEGPYCPKCHSRTFTHTMGAGVRCAGCGKRILPASRGEARNGKRLAQSAAAADLEGSTAEKIKAPGPKAPTLAEAEPPTAPAERLAAALRELGDLHASGVLTDAEFAEAKAKALR